MEEKASKFGSWLSGVDSVTSEFIDDDQTLDSISIPRLDESTLARMGTAVKRELIKLEPRFESANCRASKYSNSIPISRKLT